MVTFLKSLSLRSRLTALFVIIFGTSTIVFSSFLYISLNDSLLQDFDDALFNYAIDVSRNIDVGTKNDLLFPPLKVDEGKIFPFPSGTALIQIRYKSGEILSQSGDFGTFQFPFTSEMNLILKGQDSAYKTLDQTEGIPDAEADSYRLITYPLDSLIAPNVFLQIAVPMTTFETQLDRLKIIISFGFPVMLLIAIIFGFYLSSRALRPVQEIIFKIKKIDASNLSERVLLPNAQDEIYELAKTQNQMLDRMEKSFQAQERFIADASHQLLTPLTILRGEIEIQQKTQSLDPLFLTSALQEVENLSKIVSDMLLLARIDAGSDSLSLSDLNLDEILIDVIARVQKIANKKNITVQFNIDDQLGRKKVTGDSDLLTHLLYNLIENAVKYSFSNELVIVRLIWQEEFTIIEIADHGPGIPDDQIETVFERFSRVNPSSRTKGFGLGLAIAKKIATIHNSQLLIEKNKDSNRDTGTLFKLKLKNT